MEFIPTMAIRMNRPNKILYVNVRRDSVAFGMWPYQRFIRSSEPFHRVIHFFHKLAVKQGNDINFTDEHTPKFVKLMSVGPGLILIDSLTLYHIWSYAQQTKRTPLMKVCLKPCSLFVIQVQDPRNLFTVDLNPYSF